MLKRLSGQLQGLAYRVEGRRPDPNVTDQVLQQRVASRLGPVVKALDLPRLKVHAHDGTITLHGRVDATSSTETIRTTVHSVSGVVKVDTTGLRTLASDDDRPSHAHQTHRSHAHRELVGAVRALDVGDDQDVERLVGSVLSMFVALLPEDEQTHLEAHLPADVRGLADLAVTVGKHSRPRTVTDFVSQVANAASRTHGTAEQAVHAVLACLQDLVPEEVDDVAAVLPGELADLWRASTAPSP